MCGIAGIIYRDGEAHPIGDEMTRMLQSMKHRGPDSTGYALYGEPENGALVMRYKLADANTPRDFEFADRLDATASSSSRGWSRWEPSCTTSRRRLPTPFASRSTTTAT